MHVAICVRRAYPDPTSFNDNESAVWKPLRKQVTM
jgi:hypothetical protein